ncbi:hypothetical protein K443DRAFT_682997 [Laccaria amethystina LaAM-08-1]|uniref:Uncharacterized protein n=1 Tax=Laccaria amethystina LaAM-08-1 TaxID=1095629 RepID=A0A0C9X2S5_9AGAR|nr:hypothetical protein K443DRAFT_682997 [Laccaria amethystina LaAM-08-1]
MASCTIGKHGGAIYEKIEVEQGPLHFPPSASILLSVYSQLQPAQMNRMCGTKLVVSSKFRNLHDIASRLQ